MKLPLGAALAAAAQLAAAPVFACACCADPGQRSEWQMDMDNHDREFRAELKATGPVRVFMTACGEECVGGIDGVVDEYAGAVTFDGAGFSITLADGSGAISMAYPAEFTWFAVDPGPVLEAHGQLYSELRHDGTVAATGRFRAADGAPARLVIAGVSNACYTAGQYGRWSLDVHHGAADFRLFGDLAVEG